MLAGVCGVGQHPCNVLLPAAQFKVLVPAALFFTSLPVLGPLRCAPQVMPSSYLQQRPGLIRLASSLGAQLGLPGVRGKIRAVACSCCVAAWMQGLQADASMQHGNAPL